MFLFTLKLKQIYSLKCVSTIREFIPSCNYFITVKKIYDVKYLREHLILTYRSTIWHYFTSFWVKCVKYTQNIFFINPINWVILNFLKLILTSYFKLFCFTSITFDICILLRDIIVIIFKVLYFFFYFRRIKFEMRGFSKVKTLINLLQMFSGKTLHIFIRDF